MKFAPIARSLRRKVMVLLMATAFAALALSAVGLVIIDLRAYEKLWSDDLQTQAEILARATAPALTFGDREAAAEDLRVLRARPSVLAAAIYTRDGRLFASYVQKGAGPPAELPLVQTPSYRIIGERLEVVRPVIERTEILGTAYLVAAYEPWQHLKEYLGILVVVMALSLLLATLLSGWLQAAVTEPILEVARVARDVMTHRDYSLRARKTTRDEIGELVDSFNAMLAESGRRAEQLRDADRRKDEFLATLAHELRNPLAPLRNALEILRLSGDDPKAAAMAREIMQRQLSQMVRLVDDLLDVSRITTGKLEIRRVRTDLQTILRNAIETARPIIDAQDHELEVRMPPEPLPLDADPTRLAQVFSNLLHNAAKYTERGGRLLLTAEREHGDAVVRVSDNGIGIAPEVLPTIFEIFVQADRSLERSQSGLGVGLSLARKLVDLHGGRLSAYSEGPGKGSEFTVRIPLAVAPAADTSAEREGARAPRARHRVLLADDNVDFITTMASLISAEGHEVRIAHDGVEAIEVAREFAPDFAFVDIGMPRMNGYEVARRLREMIANCVLVAVTGWGQEDDRRRAREAGFDRHLVKPVDPGQIEAILASA